MATKRSVSVTLKHDILDFIEKEALRQNRSLSNMLETAVVEWRYQVLALREGEQRVMGAPGQHKWS